MATKGMRFGAGELRSQNAYYSTYLGSLEETNAVCHAHSNSTAQRPMLWPTDSSDSIPAAHKQNANGWLGYCKDFITTGFALTCSIFSVDGETGTVFWCRRSPWWCLVHGAATKPNGWCHALIGPEKLAQAPDPHAVG
ncbi:hypothetical protein KC347_g77 [Hortaea werneckii]|nr:hypothetical protein KC347_g77 [Hortaea werneckii]